jgi:hypothetical protein
LKLPLLLALMSPYGAWSRYKIHFDVFENPIAWFSLTTHGADMCGRFQQSSRSPHLLHRVSICLIGMLTIGCGSRDGMSNASPDDSRIKELTTTYAMYMNLKGARPPANEADFKAFISESGDALLKSAEVGTVDELFVSPRDNEPYVIAYGSEAAKMLSRGGVVIYERSGKDGRRLVGNRGGFVNELDDAEFRRLVPAP